MAEGIDGRELSVAIRQAHSYREHVVATLVLLPSPLLGPSVWQPAAQVLRSRGWTTITCPRPAQSGTAQAALDAYSASLPPAGDLVLIAHSNAGAYVPALAHRHRSVVGAVFVDAVLPPPLGWVELAPPALRDGLRARVDGVGLLPVWTEWWEEAEVAALFPSDQARRLVESEQVRLPLTYFEDRLPVPAGWDDLAAAYLSFGDTYSRQRMDAEGRQWPVATVTGEHLHQVMEPAEVVDALVILLAHIGISGGR